jgi:hypothetical protein
MHPIAINLSIVTIQHVFKSLGGWVVQLDFR